MVFDSICQMYIVREINVEDLAERTRGFSKNLEDVWTPETDLDL